MSELEVLDAELVDPSVVAWDPDYEGDYPSDWTYEQAKSATRTINTLAQDFVSDWWEYMKDAYRHRVWRGLKSEGGWEGWRAALVTPKVPAVTRKAMAIEAKREGWTINEIAAALDVSDSTIDSDTKGVTSPNSGSGNEPSTFTCSNCEKRTRYVSRVEHEGFLYCKKCSDEIDQEEKPARKPKVTPAEKTPRIPLIDKQLDAALEVLRQAQAEIEKVVSTKGFGEEQQERLDQALAQFGATVGIVL